MTDDIFAPGRELFLRAYIIWAESTTSDDLCPKEIREALEYALREAGLAKSR